MCLLRQWENPFASDAMDTLSPNTLHLSNCTHTGPTSFRRQVHRRTVSLARL
jgi:hypothetical protein